MDLLNGSSLRYLIDASILQSEALVSTHTISTHNLLSNIHIHITHFKISLKLKIFQKVLKVTFTMLCVCVRPANKLCRMQRLFIMVD